jgi:hypothetical protein
MAHKLAMRARRGERPAEEKPKRNRAFLFLLFTLGAGALSAMIALVGPSLVTDAGAVVTNAIVTNSPATQIKAQTLFPPVAAVHKVIDVYDPAPPVKRTQPAPPAAAPATSNPSPSPSPRRSPRPTPTASPTPNDN